jgi:hypothetical protein
MIDRVEREGIRSMRRLLVLGAHPRGLFGGPLAFRAGAVLVLALCAGALPVGVAQAEAGCSNEQLRAEQPYGLGLPDCRAFEMVSPIDKNDNDAVTPEFFALHNRSSVSGEAISYESLGSFAGPAGSLAQNQYVSRRGPDGWSTQGITPPMGSLLGAGTLPVAYQNLLFDPELTSGVATVATSPGTPPPGSGAPEGYVNLYLANLAEASYRTLTTAAPPEVNQNEFPDENSVSPGGFTNGGPFLAGASTDLSHIVFDSYGKLTPNAQPNANNIYEWTNGLLQLVNVENNGTGMTGGAISGAGKPYSGIFGGGADQSGAVSSDGSKVFFTSPFVTDEREEELYYEGYLEFKGEEPVFEREQGRAYLKPQLYVRENGTATVEVSASQRTVPDPNGPRPAYFWMASADGARVFFTSSAELTNNANTGPEDNAANLYEYDIETSELTDLTPDSNVGDPKGAAVLGVATDSKDGSYVYFVAKGDLAAGAISGEANLYVSHDGTTSFITKLSAKRDWADWSGSVSVQSVAYQAGRSSRTTGPSMNTVAVTPDGTHFAFESTEKPTGYDNEPVEPNECENVELENPEELSSVRDNAGPCREVFSYDTVSRSLVCASCNPGGQQPVGPARLSGGVETEPQRTLFYVPRNFSEDGSRLLFNSEDPLVPHDSNGAQDVYEYEGGHVYPVSDVAGRKGSVFLDASPSGNDVFIATAVELLRQDTDQRIDVYDVRAGGGFPVSVPPPACNNGDSCKPPESAQPGVFGAPASSTFVGAGNPTPSPLAPAAVIKPKTAAQLRAERLTTALRACRKKRDRHKRASCEKRAKARYGASKARKAKRAGTGRGATR